MAESFLSSLITSANTLKQEQQDRQKKIIDTYNSKVTQSNIFSRQRMAQVRNTTGNTVIKARNNKPFIEPNLAYEKNTVGQMSNLLKLAKDYNPSVINQPLVDRTANYLSYASSKMSTNQQNLFQGFTIGKGNLIPDRNKNIITANNRNIETFKKLNEEQNKYYGVNFSNVGVDTIANADWKSHYYLQTELEKYISLKDTYSSKYLKSGSKVDLDWVNTYSNLIDDTAKNMSKETPKIFKSSEAAAASIALAKGNTIKTLESFNTLFKENEKNTTQQKSSIESRKPIDVDLNPMKKLIEKRLNTVSNYTAKKVSPTFESRPI